jgi:hypothetical protein
MSRAPAIPIISIVVKFPRLKRVTENLPMTYILL